VAEIQTPSDTTFRVFDWGRNNPDRPLHIDQAMACIAFGAAQQLERIYQYERIRRNESGVRTGAQFTLAALAEKYRPILQSYLR
jgi:mannose-6-phosphate isomerase class I